MDPATLDIANVTLSGFDYEELSALLHSCGAFFAGDVGDAVACSPRMRRAI
jgi:hypothetical protein